MVCTRTVVVLRPGGPRNAMLTNSHREFLKSDGSGLSKSTQSDYKTAIKQRVYNTLLDFQLLWENWPEKDREEIFKETTAGNDLWDGLTAFIAMMYMENRYESGMQTALFQGANKAEAEMVDSDLNRVVNVDFAVERLKLAEYEQVIEKIRSGRLYDMTDEETRAIVNLLRKSPTVTAEDYEAMRDDIIDHWDELKVGHGEARRQRAEYAREKQLRYRQADDDE